MYAPGTGCGERKRFFELRPRQKIGAALSKNRWEEKKKVVVHHYQNQRDEVLAQQRNIAIFQRDTKTCNPVSILFEGSVLTPARVFRLVQSINAQTSKDYLAKMHTDLDFVSEALGKDAPRFSKGG